MARSRFPCPLRNDAGYQYLSNKLDSGLGSGEIKIYNNTS